MTVIFVELQGQAARERLERLQADLAEHPDVAGLELLESLEQPGLYLLVCRCRTRPDFEVPGGARLWSFQAADGLEDAAL